MTTPYCRLNWQTCCKSKLRFREFEKVQVIFRLWHSGPGKSTWPFSVTFRFLLRPQLYVLRRASRWGSGKSLTFGGKHICWFALTPGIPCKPVFFTAGSNVALCNEQALILKKTRNAYNTTKNVSPVSHLWSL